MARRRRRRSKQPDILSELLFPVVAGIALVLVVQRQLTGSIDLSVFEAAAPMYKLIALVIGLLLLLLVAGAVFRLLEQKMSRDALVRKQRYINDWFSMSPRTFEHFIAGVYEKRGYQVKEVTSYSADHGIDVVLKKDGKQYAIQVKQYRNQAIREKDLREFYGSYVSQGFDGGTFVTTSFYTRPARKWAKGVGMLLVDGDQLVKMVNKANGV